MTILIHSVTMVPVAGLIMAMAMDVGQETEFAACMCTGLSLFLLHHHSNNVLLD